MSATFQFQDIFQCGVPDPYPFYHWLRGASPIHQSQDRIPGWFISRYDDVVKIAQDRARFSHGMIVAAAVEQDREGGFWRTEAAGVLFRDGDDHVQARGLLSRVFAPERIEGLGGRLRQLADALLDRVQEAGTMDLVADFAEPLCYQALGDFVGTADLGVGTLRDWARGIGAALDPLGGPEEADQGQRIAAELRSYFRRAIEERRKHPRDDLLTDMARASWNGRSLDDELILGSLIQIMQSPDSMSLQIANAMLALIRHPDQLDLLRRDPGLAGAAVEECLRYDSPVLGFPRVASQDVDVHGHQIQKGQLVYLLYASANRDPARFPDPDRLDLRRPAVEQLAFGLGPHTCIGAPVARLFAEVALAALVRRIPAPRLAGEQLSYRKHFILHGMEALPITWGPE